MEQIYFDNAATTYPKPESVPAAVYEYMKNCGVNIARGSYGRAYGAEETIFDLRERLCRFFGGSDPKNVIFTKNITESLNGLLWGLLHAGDHVLVSGMEHNAVMRPLVRMQERGVRFSRVPCGMDGSMRAEDIIPLVGENTRGMVMIHGSNVCGTVLPVGEVGEICKKRGLWLIVDTAQTAGVLPVDMASMYIDAVAFTGHKGLMGPQGTGGFVVTDALAGRMRPFICGGTGSMSHLETMPERLPDKFEAGTLNLPGLMGLSAAMKWLEQTGTEAVYAREKELTRLFLENILPLEAEGRLRIVGRRDTENRVGVVSLDFPGRDNAEIACILDEKYGIMTRVGLHCAPAAHRTLGTYPHGTVRFSFGYYNTPQETERAAEALKEITEVCHGA